MIIYMTLKKKIVSWDYIMTFLLQLKASCSTVVAEVGLELIFRIS